VVLDVQTEFAVDMTCQSCVSAVTKALQTVPGVENYDINLEKKQVVVTGRGK
jgi:copper chaperone